MESKKVYSLFYLLLLTITAPMLAVARSEDKRDVDDERRQIAVAPLAVYAGVAVSPWVWAAILAAYGIAELTKYNRPIVTHVPTIGVGVVAAAFHTSTLTHGTQQCVETTIAADPYKL
ncbi:hypothetical protein MAR_001729 [Mya arenaria]|uniref:Uncharacterized protein n=1 Tax=Mya arenaria TaxID=6604 RepID=A0ABY7FG11_MYAAR|nr:hypothetical protein MAR_001729 [Mya arenaria]